MTIFFRPFKVKISFIFISILTIPSFCLSVFFLFTKVHSFAQFISIFILLLLIIILFQAAFKLYKNSYISVSPEIIKISQICFASQKIKLPGQHFFLKISCFTIQKKDAEYFSFSDNPPTQNAVSDALIFRPIYLISNSSTYALETCWYKKSQINLFLSGIKKDCSI